jgi:hypothetical protein
MHQFLPSSAHFQSTCSFGCCSLLSALWCTHCLAYLAIFMRTSWVYTAGPYKATADSAVSHFIRLLLFSRARVGFLR